MKASNQAGFLFMSLMALGPRLGALQPPSIYVQQYHRPSLTGPLGRHYMPKARFKDGKNIIQIPGYEFQN